MTLDARAIALQGLGFGPRLTAVQGMYAPSAESPDTGQATSIPFRPRPPRSKRHDRDDDVLLFLLH
jgi:hypothetical protein